MEREKTGYESGNFGTMDYGGGRYKILGGQHDGYEFHAGDAFEVAYRSRWVPGMIEADLDGRWYFLWPIDVTGPADVYGLAVRLPQDR